MKVSNELWSSLITHFPECPVKELNEIISDKEITPDDVVLIETSLQKIRVHEDEVRKLRQRIERMVGNYKLSKVIE
ncbi:hypothetical protein JXL21_09455 [Candidatus Bathyarchaeota archaeon]|nr:hypothetical protein [Candidatus Bathyarchaeota archaeon]